MRKIVTILFIASLFTYVACDEPNTETAEPVVEKTQEEIAEENMVEVDPNQKEFGEEVDMTHLTEFQQITPAMENQDSSEFVTQATVVEVCQMKGCWMTLTNDTTSTDIEPMMVKFKDYGFFMPKDLSGKEVVIQGKAYRQITPVDELRHYAEDAGKSEEEIMQITEPKEEIVFVADGVKIL